MKRTRLEKLRRRAIKAGLRTSRRVRHPLSREEILELRVQIIPTAPRLIMALAAISLFTAAAFSWPFTSNSSAAVEVLIGVFLLLFAIFGIRRTLSNLADQMPFEAFELLVESILKAIGHSIDL